MCPARSTCTGRERTFPGLMAEMRSFPAGGSEVLATFSSRETLLGNLPTHASLRNYIFTETTCCLNSAPGLNSGPCLTALLRLSPLQPFFPKNENYLPKLCQLQGLTDAMNLTHCPSAAGSCCFYAAPFKWAGMKSSSSLFMQA
jgi:hypothetical protein